MKRPPWFLIQKGESLTTQWLQDGRRLPTQAWQIWLRIMLGGWVVGVGFLLLLVGLMQRLLATGLVSPTLEGQWLHWLVAQAPMHFSDAIWLSAPGDITIVVPILVAAALLAARAHWPVQALTILLSYFMVSALVLIGWLVWDRPRPELIAGGLAAPAFHSFPSGHMAQSITVYGLFGYLWLRQTVRRSEQIFGLGLLSLWLGNIAFTRLVLGSHWPSDVVAGTLLGLFWLGVLMLAIAKAEAYSQSAQGQNNNTPVSLSEPETPRCQTASE